MFSLRRVARLCAWAVIVLGGLVLVGWTLDVDALKGVFPHLTAMNPVTALGLILAGGALELLQDEAATGARQRAGRICAGLTTLTGLAKLGSYLWNAPIYVDQWLFAQSVAAAKNQIAPNTAFVLLIIGAALLLLDVRTRRAHWPSQWFTLAASLIALFALVGYAYGATSLFGVGGYIPMALNTAVATALLCLGIFFARPDRGLMAAITANLAGGQMARRLLPAAIGIPVVLGWLRTEGQAAGFFDTALGTALLVMLTVVI